MTRYIGLDQARGLLKVASATIRSLNATNQELQMKLAAREREDRVEKIARDMESKGLNSELSYEEKVANLLGAQNLDVTEEAVKMAAPQGNLMGIPSDQPGGSEHPFVTFLRTGESE